MGKLMLNLPLSRGISISVELIKTNPFRSNSVETELKLGKPEQIKPSTNLFNQIHFNQDINNFYKKG
jgi:hypothetical protein